MRAPERVSKQDKKTETDVHTLVESIDTTTLRELVGEKNTGKDGEQTAAQPPAKRVTKEVNLLARVVLGPETDTTEQERPLDGHAGIGVAAGESVVVVEHGALQLKVFLQERDVLDLARLFLCALRVLGQSGNVLGVPDVAGLQGVLVAVNFGLLVSPVRQRGRVSPHGDLGRNVDELEVDRHGLEVGAGLCAVNPDLEEGVVEALAIGLVVADSGEFLVGGVVRRSDVVGEKPSVCDEMAQTDNITDVNTVAGLLRDGFGRRNNLPEVVGVVVRVSSDLLALRRNAAIVVTERVSVGVTVEVDLCVLVADVDGVKVVDADRLLRHDVVAERLLEFGAHKVVAGTGSGQDGEVDLEPEEVQHEGNDNQTSDTGSQVLAEFGQTEGALSAVDVEKRPEVNGDGDTDGEEGEGTNVLGRDDTAEADTGQEQPLPPLAAKGGMAELVEADVAEHRKSHEEDQRGVEQDQSGLANVCIVEQDEPGSQNTGRQGVAGLPHDHKNGRYGQGAHGGRHCAVCNVGHLVGDVAVANVFKQKVAIVSHQPAGEREQELAERRVHVEEVGSLEVVRGELGLLSAIVLSACCRRCYLAKVDLIKDDLVGVGNGIEAGCKGEEGDDGEGEFVVPVIGSSSLGLAPELRQVFAALVDCIVDLFLGNRRSLFGARR